MNDTEAFLRKIRENPDDDAPRLVFADYLDEQANNATGKAAKERAQWAAMIRAQIAEERESLADGSFWNKWAGVEAPKENCLARRLLPKRFQDGWRSWLNKGFYDELIISFDVLVKGKEKLLDSVAPIRKLQIFGIDGRWNQIAGHPVLNLIRGLDLDDDDMDEDSAVKDIEDICNDPQLCSLTSLTIPFEYEDEFPDLTKNENFTALRNLEVGDDFSLEWHTRLLYSPMTCQLEEYHASPSSVELALVMSQAPLSKTLTRLLLRHAEQNFPKKPKWGNFKNLRTLDIWKDDKIDWLTPFLESQDLQQITKLRIAGSNIPENVLSYFEKGESDLSLMINELPKKRLKEVLSSKIMQRVKSLSLDNENIEYALQILAKNDAAINLGSLTLDVATKVSSEFINCLCNSPVFANLLHLHTQADITLASLKKLAKSRMGQSLRALMIRQPKKTDSWQQYFRDSQHFPQLVHLSNRWLTLENNLVAKGRKKLKLT